MYKILSALLICLTLTFFSCNKGSKNSDRNPDNKGTVNNNLESGKITVGATEESLDLAQRLASNYVSQNTNIIIDVISLKPSEIQEALDKGSIQLAVTGGTTNPFPEMKAELVASDLMVLCVSRNNPALQKLVMRGLDGKELNSIFAAGTMTNWNQVDNKCESTPLKPLTGPENSSSFKTVLAFLASTSFSKTTTALMSEGELEDAVGTNPGSIAFMSHRKAYNTETKMKTAGLYVIPIDLNANNLADDTELVYDDLNLLSTAYGKGNFATSLVRNHYFVYSEKAERLDIVKAFTEYATTEGAGIVSAAGYFEPKKK